MSTITLWLLVSIGTFGSPPSSSPSTPSIVASPTIVLERFLTQEDCRDARAKIENAYRVYQPRLACVQVKIARTGTYL